MYVGSIIGSAIPIPVVETVVGAVAGYAVGGFANWIYDDIAHNERDLENDFKLF